MDDEPCTRCTCQLGEVSCEKVPCQQACTDPSPPPGDCCSSCPDSVFPPGETQALTPQGDAALGKAARSPRGDTQAPVNCSSCPGPPPAAPPRPALHLLQLLLRTNVSNMQTLPTGPSKVQASLSPPLRPGGTFPEEPRASQPPQLSPGSSTSSEPSTLPPTSPGARWPLPVTPERFFSASGAQTVSRWPLPTTLLTEASAPSTMVPGPSETPTTPLRPHRLSAGLVATTHPGPQQPTKGTSREEESTV